MTSIDLDIFKYIADCPGVYEVKWRVSSSGLGFHVRWKCARRNCRQCLSIRKMFDDTRRFCHDVERIRNHRTVNHADILWDEKNGRTSGPWHFVKLKPRSNYARKRVWRRVN